MQLWHWAVIGVVVLVFIWVSADKPDPNVFVITTIQDLVRQQGIEPFRNWYLMQFDVQYLMISYPYHYSCLRDARAFPVNFYIMTEIALMIRQHDLQKQG